MGRKGALSESENFKITQRLHNNLSNLEIAKELGRDHRTVKKFAINPTHCNSVLTRKKFRSNHLFRIVL